MKKDWFTIVIANYNGEDFLPKCLSSIFLSTDKKFTVLIVDDCSTDKSISIIKSLKKHHKNLQFLVNPKNLGPSGSRNNALAHVATEYIYFLDNDTEVTPDWLKEVRKVFMSDTQVISVQSLLVDYENRSQIQNSGLKLIRQTGWAIGLDAGLDISKAPHKPTEIIGLSAGLAVRAEAFEKGIHFDPKFVHYSEDLDFSWRLWIAGYKSLLAPASIVYHHVKSVDKRKNVGANSEIIYFHLAKNSLRSMTKNYEFHNLLWYFPQCVLILILRAVLVLVVRRQVDSLVGTLKAFWWYALNLRDTLRERNIVQMSIRKVPDSIFLNKIMVNYGLLEIYKRHFSQTKLLPL